VRAYARQLFSIQIQNVIRSKQYGYDLTTNMIYMRVFISFKISY